jgi:hypothetical protein
LFYNFHWICSGNNRIIIVVHTPYQEDVEACDDIEPLEIPPPPPDEVIVGFQGGKENEILVISYEEYDKELMHLA